MEGGVQVRSSSSMTPHPHGALSGESLLLLQGGQGQSMEGVEQGPRCEVPEGAEKSARKAQRFDEKTVIPRRQREVKHFTPNLQDKFDK